MRNMRGALWALGLAGAAYAWRNRDKLQQQFGQLGSRRTPQQLPDYGSSPQPQSQDGYNSWQQPREGQQGGSEV